jgi:RHS repeat-associated protein
MGTGYRWRSQDQIAGLIDVHAGPTWFEHDARSYLVAAARPDGSVQYRAPDAAGNVYRSPDRRDRTYGPGGRLEAADGARHVHDEDGQLVEKVMPDGARWRYAWDHAGQLREVVRPDGQRVTFAYDALGRRVRKTFGGRTTTYVWDGNDLVHELTEGEALVTWEFEPGKFAPIAKVEGDRRYGVVTDHLGTPVALFDERGELAWKAKVDLYGVPREEVARTGCPWRWPGQYEDEETGLYYNRFRYYDPEAGTYISQDPIGLRGGLNLFGYVLDPLRRTDPLGLSETCTTIYRGTDFGNERRIFEETGHVMSDAARRGYMESRMAGNSIERALEDAMTASIAAHQKQLDVWGSLGAYVEAHGHWGQEITQFGERSLISFTTDPSVTNRFGGTVFSGAVPTNRLIPQTIGGSEAEVLVEHMIKLR